MKNILLNVCKLSMFAKLNSQLLGQTILSFKKVVDLLSIKVNKQLA